MIVLVSLHLLLMVTIAVRVVTMRVKTSMTSPNARRTQIRPLTTGVITARTTSTSMKKMQSLKMLNLKILSLKTQRRKKTRSQKIPKTLIRAAKLPQPRHLLLLISMIKLTRITSMMST